MHSPKNFYTQLNYSNFIYIVRCGYFSHHHILIVESVCFRSAYLLYYFDVHQILQQEFPNLPQSEINKRISESWKRLSVAEKGYYLEKAKSEKDGTVSSTSLTFDFRQTNDFTISGAILFP